MDTEALAIMRLQRIGMKRPGVIVTPHEMLQQDTLSILRQAAEIADPGGYGAWAYDTWAEHNAAFFNGELRPGGIAWGLTCWGDALGQYEPWRDMITLHSSLVHPSGNAWGIGKLLGPRFAADVLLHEMVHQAITQRGIVERESHNAEAFTNEINRISALLGLDCKAKPIKQRRVNGYPRRVPDEGYMTQKEISAWPHSVRPAGYYEPEAALLLGQVLG